MKKIHAFFKTLQEGALAPVVQFVKFGIVGLSNTCISYAIEMLCYYVLFRDIAWNYGMKVIVVTAIAFVISVTNSYYWNSRYVFQSAHKRTLKMHLIAYMRTFICYAITGLVLAPLLRIWLGKVHVVYWLASLFTLIVTIPLNFILNKFWAFSRSDKMSQK